jgi:hypothetical protein
MERLRRVEVAMVARSGNSRAAALARRTRIQRIDCEFERESPRIDANELHTNTAPAPSSVRSSSSILLGTTTTTEWGNGRKRQEKADATPALVYPPFSSFRRLRAFSCCRRRSPPQPHGAVAGTLTRDIRMNPRSGSRELASLSGNIN